MKKYNLLIFGSGRGSNFNAICGNIDKNFLQAKISVIVSDNPDAKMIEDAKILGLKTIVVEKNQLNRIDHEKCILDKLSGIHYDLVILAGYMRVLSKDFICKLGKPVLNIHPSLLPSFKGLHAQKQALEYGVKITGCTVHLVDEILDGGKILGQRSVLVLNTDTEDSLSEKILAEEHILYSEIIQNIILKKIEL